MANKATYKTEEANMTNYTVNHPEMSGEKTQAEIVCHVTFGNRFMAKTELFLKGRGIQDYGKDNAGKNTYCITGRAFSILCEKHEVAIDALLS
jgi:hypothetical protein